MLRHLLSIYLPFLFQIGKNMYEFQKYYCIFYIIYKYYFRKAKIIYKPLPIKRTFESNWGDNHGSKTQEGKATTFSHSYHVSVIQIFFQITTSLCKQHLWYFSLTYSFSCVGCECMSYIYISNKYNRLSTRKKMSRYTEDEIANHECQGDTQHLALTADLCS